MSRICLVQGFTASSSTSIPNGSMPSFAALRPSASTLILRAGKWLFGIQHVVLRFSDFISLSPHAFLRLQVSRRESYLADLSQNASLCPTRSSCVLKWRWHIGGLLDDNFNTQLSVIIA